MKKIQSHILLYIFEMIILAVGFILILNIDFTFWTQFFILTCLLLFYVFLGLIRHTRDHDISYKVVIEYVSIALIIALLFVFINVSRI